MDVGRAGKLGELERIQAELAQRSAGRVGAASGFADTSVAISRPADLLKRLSTLRQSDPERFKLLMGQVSANLRAAGNSDRGPVGTQLNKLSAGLARAAKSGDLSSLQPTLDAPLDRPTLGTSTQRALAAYRRNLPPERGSNETLEQALDYVRSVVDAEP